MTLCRKGEHDLDLPDNVGVQRSTGRQFCRACKREYRKALRRRRRPPTNLCKGGLHDLSDEANVYARPGTGRRECRACKVLAEKQRREAKAARAAEAEAERGRREVPAGADDPQTPLGSEPDLRVRH